MTWYTFLLFVHVAMAVIWIGGGLMMQLFGVRASSLGDRTRLANLGEDVAFIGPRLFVPASLLAFLSGVLLVIESDFYGPATTGSSSVSCCTRRPFSPGFSSSVRSPAAWAS